MTGTRKIALVFALASLSLAACSTSPGTPADTTVSGSGAGNPTSAAGVGGTVPASGLAGVDPCVLVTAAEAEAAIGVTVAATQPEDMGASTACVYMSADGRNSLAVTVVDGGMDKAEFDLTANGSDLWAPVAGVGSDAYFNADNDTLTAWQSNNAITITIADESGNTSPAQIQATEIKVANTALGRV
jgi:predicted small secreted protein